ncbi:hypothetical protein [Nubsella zeaxanthinifaciens]|uniref:hypothetical protein n=1 Tax=Nubsella zeaxanthinifaciens TaxID=392412 RepID=UPI000DE24E3B|nr:hypothetical protein [Nubsella zeaxanthinifaciens]
MPQIPPISNDYINDVIKSDGPFIETINKTQGIKLRELIKMLRDYFDQEMPKNTSDLVNDSNFVNAAFLAGIPNQGNQKHPFIIKPLEDWDPNEVFGTGNQPVNTMLVATEFNGESYVVTQLKISDGITAFGDLKNLIINGVINGGTSGQSLEKKSVVNGDAAWVDIPQKIADVLALKLNIADYNQHFRGKYASLAALQSAVFNPALQAGDYAQVDAGTGSNVKNYNWDVDDNTWVEGSPGSGANNTDQLTEGTSNLYFTSTRAIDAVANDYVRKSGNVSENIFGKKSFQQAPSLNSLTGNRVLSLSAAKEIESFYEITLPVITNTTIISQLTTAGNWNASDVYTGSAIVGAYQMQFYADANYWYYFYNDTTPIRISRRAAQLAATDVEAQAGTSGNKYLTPLNWTYLKTIANNISALWQFTVGIGIGIAGVTSSFLKIGSNTTAKSQLNLTPSAVDVNAPINGDVWNNNGEIKLVDNTIVNRLLKTYNNELLKSTGNYFLLANQYGDISATVEAGELWVYDSEILSAISSATWTSNRATITPANNKVMLKGQMHDDGSFTYFAVNDNVVRRW